MPAPRIVIVDAQPVVRDALAERLRTVLGEVDVVDAGGRPDEAIASARVAPVDCVIVDPDLGDGRPPPANVADLVGAGLPVLVFSASSAPVTVRACLRGGARGYVTKQSPTQEVVDAVRAILRGERYESRDVARWIVDDRSLTVQLSDREREAMVLYASGLKIDAVARRMGVKPSTAGEYIKRVRSKYGQAGMPLPTKTDLYRQARSEGLVA